MLMDLSSVTAGRGWSGTAGTADLVLGSMIAQLSWQSAMGTAE